jgi:hypothetical protein
MSIPRSTSTALSGALCAGTAALVQERALYIYIGRHYFYYGTPPLPPGARRHTPPPLLAAPLTADSQACADCQRVATNVADSLAFSLQKRIVGAIMASPT